MLVPLVNGVWLSFFHWDGIGPREFAGLDNYHEIVTGDTVRPAFRHAAVLVVMFSILPVTIALFIVGSIARVRVRGLDLLRAIYFMPQVIAPVVIGVSWVAILDIDGPVNAALRRVGLDGVARAWLGDYTWALPAIGIIGTWATFGLCLVLFISGVQSIPRSLYEAARVDGAGPVREFLAVTLPGIRNQLAVALTLTVLAGLRTFDLIYVTTKGGPGTETMVPSLLIYTRAFVTGQVGSAAAIAVVLTLVILLLTLLIIRVVEPREGRAR